MNSLSIDKKHYEINGGGFDPKTDYRYISLGCFDAPDDDESKSIQIPIPITDEKWFEKIQDYNKDLLNLEKDSDILDNLQGKIESDFYLDKLNIDGKFEIWKQEENCLVLLCCNGKLDDGSDGLAVRLPPPLRFDEEWFKKFKENNITRGSLICYHIDVFLK